MDPLEFLKIIRRRWIAVVATIAIALGLAWTTTHVAKVGLGPPALSYKATAVLLDLRSSSLSSDAGGIDNLRTIAALVTVGDVPVRAARTLKSTQSPQALAGAVTATADIEAGLIRIAAVSPDPRQAEKLANTFTSELLGFLRDRKAATIADQAQSITTQLDALDRQIRSLDSQIQKLTKAKVTGSRVDILNADRFSKIRQYSFLSDQYQSLTASAGEPDRFLKIQDAIASPVAATGFRPPRTAKSRLIFGGILGLLLGVALALVLDRLDTRIRSRDEAEENFGLPVLAEIPKLRRANLRPSGVPGGLRSAPGDAFRLLSAGVMANGHKHVDHDGVAQNGSASRVILVTSAGSAEGKSTVVAYLAAILGTAGKRVLVLSCDLRRPTVHSLLGAPNDDGMAELLSMNGDGRLDAMMHETTIPRVSIVASGHVAASASELLDSAALRRTLADARRQADVVLIDTPPILTGDAATLVSAVDGVLVVARAGATPRDVARRAGELLRRLDAPVVGVALNRSREAVIPNEYYRRHRT